MEIFGKLLLIVSRISSSMTAGTPSRFECAKSAAYSNI